MSETRHDYAIRKQREIALLARHAGCAAAAVEPGAALQAEKQRLRARLLARAIEQAPALTESNLSGAPTAQAAGRTLAYQYQRHDLLLQRSKPFAATLHPLPQLAAAPSFGLYTGSGMAAVSAALLAFEHLAAAGGDDDARLHIAGDAYFETRQLAASYLPRLTAGGAARATLLYLDSIAARDPGARLDSAPAGLRAVLFDTTCYDAASPRIARVVAACQRRRCLLVLVRSHLKLDCLGSEYFRLGSLSVLLPPRPAPAQVAQAKRLRGTALDLLAKTGGLLLPWALPPFALDPEFVALNRARNLRLARANRVAARLLGRAAAPHRVDEPHHGCFFVVRPLVDTRVEVAAAAVALVAALRDAGLAAQPAPSFGYDFIAVQPLHDPRARASALRVALPDLCDDDLRRAIATLRGWLDGLL